jgi:hypothetical protein
MTRMGFEPMIPVFEQAKTVHALDRAATMILYLIIFQYGCTCCHWRQTVLHVSYAANVELHQNHNHNDLLARYYLYFMNFLNSYLLGLIIIVSLTFLHCTASGSILSDDQKWKEGRQR